MSERFLARLDRVVSSTDPLARDRIQHKIESLLQAGGTSYRRLVALIQDSHQPPDIRAAACWLVGYLGYRRALPSLLQALTDNSAEVQVEATRAVGKLHEVSAVPRLTTLLASDSDNQVREAAAYALGQIRSEGAIEPLVAILVDPHEQPDLRSRAAESLGDLAFFIHDRTGRVARRCQSGSPG